MAVTLDRRSLGRGVATYLAITVPSGIVVALVGSSNSTGSAAVLAIAGVLIFAVAPLAAGFRAGSGQRAPYVHGGLSVALPASAYLLVWLVDHLIRGKVNGADVVTFLLYFLIEVGLGMLGGYLGFRRSRRAT
ncbi:MAG: hypothetical protein ACRDZ8_14300 [Acidimicrobiales bacterium]